MARRTKCVLTALTAMLVLAFAVSSATALRSIQVTGGPGVSASSFLRFGEAEAGGRLVEGREVECNVTLLRTITERIPKSAGSVIGKTTGVAIDLATCRSGIGRVEDVQALQEERVRAPVTTIGTVRLYDVSRAAGRLWQLIYDTFLGVLPEITGVGFHIEGAQFLFRIGGINCLYVGSAFGLIAIQRETGNVTGAAASLERTALRKTGEALCLLASRANGTFSGNFTVSPALRIRLL